jgi:hypothetical protein
MPIHGKRDALVPPDGVMAQLCIDRGDRYLSAADLGLAECLAIFLLTVQYTCSCEKKNIC